MKIAISCSMKYHDLIRETIAKLTTLGLTPLFPNLNHEDGTKQHTLLEKKELAMEHYKAIDKADVTYFITPTGYLGTSCKLELGYAVASKKPIYFSEPTKDSALDCYVEDFTNIDSLENFLKL